MTERYAYPAPFEPWSTYAIKCFGPNTPARDLPAPTGYGTDSPYRMSLAVSPTQELAAVLRADNQLAWSNSQYGISAWTAPTVLSTTPAGTIGSNGHDRIIGFSYGSEPGKLLTFTSADFGASWGTSAPVDLIPPSAVSAGASGKWLAVFNQSNQTGGVDLAAAIYDENSAAADWQLYR